MHQVHEGWQGRARLSFFFYIDAPQSSPYGGLFCVVVVVLSGSGVQELSVRLRERDAQELSGQRMQELSGPHAGDEHAEYVRGVCRS